MFKVLFTYIAKNKILALVISFFLFSTTLKATACVDICIPCLWKLLFEVHCLGCGLTTAFIGLIELDLNKAFESNWLIFIIVPFVIYYMTLDYIKFKINTTYKRK